MISEKKLLIGNVIKISWLPLWKPAGELVMPLSWSREPSNSELLYCHLPSDWFAQNEDEQSHPSAQIMVLQIAPKLDNHRNTAHKCSGHNSAPDELRIQSTWNKQLSLLSFFFYISIYASRWFHFSGARKCLYSHVFLRQRGIRFTCFFTEHWFRYCETFHLHSLSSQETGHFQPHST